MKIIAARALFRMLAWCPLRVHRVLAGWIGAGIEFRGGRRARRTRDQIAGSMPEQTSSDRDHLVRASLVAQARTVLEVGALWHRSRDWIEARIESVEGMAHVEAALERGRGTLLLGGHLGQWELAMLYAGLHLPVAFLYKPPRSAPLDRALTDARGRFGAEMIPSTGPALRRAVRQLRSNKVLGMLFDQRPRGGHSVPAEWFGQSVPTMTLPHRLIQRTGCSVVMGHAYRLDDCCGWKIVFEPVPGAGDPDAERACSAMNRALERAIRRAPAQYLWSYPRLAEGPESLGG